jgi:ribonuclease HI
MTLAECNNVQLLWVLRHKGIEGDETADQLARKGADFTLL